MMEDINLGSISKQNVGKIAERIVANELEARGFRVTDLNTYGLAANADLLAAGHGRVWQIQVKGATNLEKERWRIQYGHCTVANIDGTEPMFNRHASFYTADTVALVAVRAPNCYCCVVLPVKEAEQAAQLNLNRYHRKRKLDGDARKPSKIWVYLERSLGERRADPLLDEERALLKKHKNAWAILCT
ncbi:hypothetical protein FRZ44_33430 [Hypericibacter terrae]|uniref:PD(D/E)XK endonuclease domain-containing protein n=1 Tax=Hypericibacter terrae TaxID=2602015 RepID=A0A5J6ML08_9PROT|nr:hypothetical protein [Hypericibacter terrae]QEX18039.1 hypothetical protein FRZ44_33430 [Hypericibacter terrae]